MKLIIRWRPISQHPIISSSTGKVSVPGKCVMCPLNTLHHHGASAAAAVVVGGEMFKMRRLTTDNIWKAPNPLWRLMFREKGEEERDSSGGLELERRGEERENGGERRQRGRAVSPQAGAVLIFKEVKVQNFHFLPNICLVYLYSVVESN